jgi:hypothetical protein
MSLMTSKAVLLAKHEVTPGTAVALDAAADAALVGEPEYSVDPQVLERNFSRDTFSPLEHKMGRILGSMSFQHEIRGNSPMLRRLLAACGMVETTLTGNDMVRAVNPGPDNVNSITWAKGGTAAVSSPVLYTLTVTDTDELTITNNNPTEDDLSTPQVTGSIVSGTTAVALGGSGATLTPTGTFNTGDSFTVLVVPANTKGFAPTSVLANMKTMTMALNRDGLKFGLVNAQGTVSITGEAGGYAIANFTFTGQHQTVVDQAFPNATYEQGLPPCVEQSLLTWGSSTSLIAAGFELDLANSIAPRPDVNSAQGYNGVRINGRTPTGSFSPEATLEGTNPFWGDFEAAKSRSFFSRVGTSAGNMVAFYAPKAQSSGLTPGDRDNIMTYDVAFGLKGFNGDDEVEILFM